ncbi:acyltransferase family protein [Kineococcus sp. LSe6-4]|uniref:Acyltransferase family protein n=1 Tax=Kineococcus halophytocola TaxID=3234027 RepID=A0ABV4GYG6_9ACTN
MTVPGPRPADPASRPGGRLRALDALRLLAALAVLAFHFTARDHTRWGALTGTVFPHLSALTAYGYAGVHLFFVVSGVVVTASAAGRGVGAFVASRVSRLYPAYWAAVLLTATLRWLWPGFGDRTPAQVAVNLTMVQDLFGVPRVDGVYWTLWVELQFYLLVVVLLLLGWTRRRLLAAATWVPLLGTALVLAVPPAAGVVTLLGYAPLFAAGIVLHVLHRDGHTVRRWLLLVLNTAQAAVLAALAQAPAVADLVSRTHVSVAVLAAVVTGCVGLVAVTVLVPRVRDLDRRWLTAAGTLTYPLYLTHEYVGWALIEVLAPRAGRWGTLAVTVAGCLALAWGLHRLVERPLQRPFRAWLLARFTRTGGPGPSGAGHRGPMRSRAG